jgi:hypothetical protein
MKRQPLVIRKVDALDALGDGSVVGAARALGIQPQAVSAWKPILTERTAFRVIAGLLLRGPSDVTGSVRRLLFGGGSPQVKRAVAALRKAVRQEEGAA